MMVAPDGIAVLGRTSFQQTKIISSTAIIIIKLNNNQLYNGFSLSNYSLLFPKLDFNLLLYFKNILLSLQ